MESYVQSHCKHQDLFRTRFQQSWLEDGFVRALGLLAASPPDTSAALLEQQLLQEIFPGVYSLPIFKPSFCNMIIEETEHFLEYAAKHDLEVHRPNSMNAYGLVLNQMGMMDLLTDLQQQFLLPLSRALFPVEASHFTSHHSFTVSYSPDTDRTLDMHTDDSDVTWNICLGKDGFEGSGLTFCGVMAQPDHRQLQGKYAHRIGHAVVHLGHQRHGADEILSGERHNLVVWSKNQVYRESALFDQVMRAYLPEEGPPSLQCLSYTHDRDFLAFREYPEGTNPYRNLYESSEEEEGAKVMLPWCPPTRFGYEGMLSHNKLMLLHYERECEREDKQHEAEMNHTEKQTKKSRTTD